VFYFTLPGSTEPTAGNDIQPTPAEDVAPKAAKKLKILIAEDDETSGILLSLAVKKFGNEIRVVGSGTEAVDACRLDPDIDLVMMDIKMPGIDGYEATRQIRQFNKNVFIIAQTAFGQPGDSEKAIMAGCDDYITKPINIYSLKMRIQKHFISEKEGKTPFDSPSPGTGQAAHDDEKREMKR
jgi:CheY-like chemotaxis protein